MKTCTVTTHNLYKHVWNFYFLFLSTKNALQAINI